jgi:TolA-binding protein
MTAAELFSAANQARRQGDLTVAQARYQELHDRFPSSEQTALSYVLLGRIDLKNGSATTALQKFNKYLEVSPTGALAPEALEGRAEAYRQLGRQNEEASALRELLRHYPDSSYKPAAEARLRELP